MEIERWPFSPVHGDRPVAIKRLERMPRDRLELLRAGQGMHGQLMQELGAETVGAPLQEQVRGAAAGVVAP
jgi:hypothetical protein